jgi:hypothetical protein
MIDNGADWLHMGGSRMLIALGSADNLRCHGRVRSVILSVLTSSHFVPNITMGPPILTHVKKNVPDIFMDCHMMVSNPKQVGDWDGN